MQKPSYRSMQAYKNINKSYFHVFQPHCQTYLKAKKAHIEKARKLKQAKLKAISKSIYHNYENNQKQNYCSRQLQLDKENIGSQTAFFSFKKPKIGYYTLKGCNIQKVKSLQKQTNQPSRANNYSQDQYPQSISSKSQFLNYFLKKYVQRKQKKQKFYNNFPHIKLNNQFPSIHSLSEIDENLSKNENNKQRIQYQQYSQNEILNPASMNRNSQDRSAILKKLKPVLKGIKCSINNESQKQNQKMETEPIEKQCCELSEDNSCKQQRRKNKSCQYLQKKRERSLGHRLSYMLVRQHE